MSRNNRLEPDQNLLVNIAEVAEIVSHLETAHQHQLQLIKSLSTVSWDNAKANDFSDSQQRMEKIGKRIQTDISSKIDVLFQRVGCLWFVG
jgi:hypothetical protein